MGRLGSRSRRPARRRWPGADRRRGGRAGAPSGPPRWRRRRTRAAFAACRDVSVATRTPARRWLEHERAAAGRRRPRSRWRPSRRLASARPNRRRVVDVQLEHGLALGHLVARLGQAARRPATALTGSSLRARPAPSRQAATPTPRASRRVDVPGAAAATTVRRRRRRAAAASGSPPWAAIISLPDRPGRGRRRAPRRGRRRRRPAPASPGPARA